MIQRLKDLWLEWRIELAFSTIMCADTDFQRKYFAHCHAQLIAKRSQKQVARMEKKRGAI